MPTGRVIVQQWVSIDSFAADADGVHEVLFAVVDHDADRGGQEWNVDLIAEVDEVVLGRRSCSGAASPSYRPSPRCA